MFNNGDIDIGRAIVVNKLLPHLKQIQWEFKTVDNLVSYLVHHRFLNTVDTRRALLYLCAMKYNARDTVEFMARIDIDDSIFIPLLINIMDDYIGTRDYKVLQYIYYEKYASLYSYAFYLYLVNAKESSVWRRSIMIWDVDFYKHIEYMIIHLPPFMRRAVMPALIPDKEFLSKLKLYDMNSKAFKYYEHKIEMIRNISEKNIELLDQKLISN